MGANEPIAIVGIGCRFPGGASSADTYWELLREGRSAIRSVPSDRWNIGDYYDENPDSSGKMATRWGGFLDVIDRFDAEFFGISPRECITMDPQQRLMLEVCWEALEDAAIAPHRLERQRAGVFMGVTGGDYIQLLLFSWRRRDGRICIDRQRAQCYLGTHLLCAGAERAVPCS